MAAASKKNPFLNGFALGLFSGLGLALIVAVLVTQNNPFVSNDGADASAGTTESAAPVDSPRYEFSETPSQAAQPQTDQASALYYLQAGAFSNAGEADQMKARLALLGFEARVEVSGDQDKAPLSRVQIGPYKALDELNSARARLTQSGIETILVKMPSSITKQETP